jgi:polyisoprenoid-binding protein YceI
VTLDPGTYTLGPSNGSLTVRTGRTGAAAKAGHDLVIEVGSWEATLDLSDTPGEPAITLTADSRSLRVTEGIGGMPFGEKEKASATQSIDEDVLKGTAVEFRSTEARANPDRTRISVRGELELAGKRRPVEFELAIGADNRLTGEATLKQTEWGMKPYSILFGTLKVADEVQVAVDARLG